MPRTSRRRPGRTVVHLALQGGGAHGAFTWGVLDRLLEEPDIAIGRISGSSAGALNGAALATGLARGGAAAGQASLSLLWSKVAQAGSLLTLLMLPLRKPGMGVWDDAMPLFSPYQTNLLAMEPLRHVLGQVVDIGSSQRCRRACAVRQRRECADRLFARVRARPTLDRRAAGIGLRATDFPGRGDRGRVVLGRQLCMQSAAVAAYQGETDCDILMVELTPLRRAETPPPPRTS